MNLSKPPRCPVYTRAMREDREMVVATFLARLWSRAEFRCETLAAALAVIAVFVLSAIAFVDPGQAHRATPECGVVEEYPRLLEAAQLVLSCIPLTPTTALDVHASSLGVSIVTS